jgi:GH15 family glucan-1,4-alpha-glucosidase
MDKLTFIETMVGEGHEPRYWPINQYGVIGDCRTAALIGPNGSVDWCCLPHFDSSAAFCRLLDADRGGFFQISPEDPAKSTMTYLPSTNVLETVFTNEHGRLRLVDFAPIRKRPQKSHILDEVSRLISHAQHGLAAGLERELGNDVAAAHRITRILTCLEGAVPAQLHLKVTFDFARQRSVLEETISRGDMSGAILTTPARDRFLVLVVQSVVNGPAPAAPAPLELPLEISPDMQVLKLRVMVRAGEALVAHLNYARTLDEARALLAQLPHQSASADLEETFEYWRSWSSSCKYTGVYQQVVLRSALALKLCTFEPTGAIIASPTTSLPEVVGGERNWDYRFTWLRDSSFTLDALGRLGYEGEARDYFHFLHDLQIHGGADLWIMYGIHGERGGELAEYELSHLEGYRGSRPVRVGNGAATQQQLDIYGEVLAAACRYLDHEGFKDQARLLPARDLRLFSSEIANFVAENWQRLDRGIWEVRGAPRAFVYSRAMCWVALERAGRIANHHGHHRDRERWEVTRNQIRDDLLYHGFNGQLDSFVQAYHSTVLDAANLRIPLASFLPWTDPRVSGTVQATKRILSGPHGLVYRYGSTDASADVDDGLSGAEGTFLACAFWLIENLCYLGQLEEARERFEALLELGGPLGLYSEEFDPESGECLGNYPQAFTHIGLINCAVTLQHAQEGTLSR